MLKIALKCVPENSSCSLWPINIAPVKGHWEGFFGIYPVKYGHLAKSLEDLHLNDASQEVAYVGSIVCNVKFGSSIEQFVSIFMSRWLNSLVELTEGPEVIIGIAEIYFATKETPTEDIQDVFEGELWYFGQSYS